ncbi:MAG: hypothetical protein AAF957_27420 [Planctomycetota bacterium]
MKVALLALSLLVCPSGQDVPAEAPTADARARWESLGPKERAALVERYERLKELGPEERAKLLDRGKKLEREIEATLRSLDPEERAVIEALEPAERRRVLRGLVGDRARRSAALLRSRLTPEQQAALEQASPDEREALLREVRANERRRASEQLSMFATELGLGDGDVKRLQAGSREERRAFMVDVARRRAKKHVEEHGLPRGVPQRRWDATLSADDDQFVRGYLRIRARHPEFGVPPRRWAKIERRRDAMANRLEAYSSPTTRERADARGKRDRQLRKQVLLEKRSRVEETMVRMGSLPNDVAARLRALDDDDFARAYTASIVMLRRGTDLRTGLGRWFAFQERGERTGTQRGKQRGGARRGGRGRGRPQEGGGR